MLWNPVLSLLFSLDRAESRAGRLLSEMLVCHLEPSKLERLYLRVEDSFPKSTLPTIFFLPANPTSLRLAIRDRMPSRKQGHVSPWALTWCCLICPPTALPQLPGPVSQPARSCIWSQVRPRRGGHNVAHISKGTSTLELSQETPPGAGQELSLWIVQNESWMLSTYPY